MPDDFSNWLDGAPVLVVSKDETFGAWLDGAPVVDESFLTSPIAGAPALTFTPAGTLTGSGALLGSCALTFTPAAVLTGSGALAGSCSLTFTPAGDCDAVRFGSGSTSLAFNTNDDDDLTGFAFAVGSISFVFSQNLFLQPPGRTSWAWALSGTIKGSGKLASAYSWAFTPAGSLSRLGYMTGTAALAVSGVGLLTDIGRAPPLSETSSATRAFNVNRAASILAAGQAPVSSRAPAVDVAATVRAPTDHADTAATVNPQLS